MMDLVIFYPLPCATAVVIGILFRLMPPGSFIIGRVVREVLRVPTVGIHEVDLPVAVPVRLKSEHGAVRRPAGGPFVRTGCVGQVDAVGAVRIDQIEIRLRTVTGAEGDLAAVG